ncbi:ribonuclease H-like domain-containing protein [Tanacetum coccineum]
MTPTQPPSYQFLDDNLDTSPIAICLLTTPTSPQQTLPQTTPQTTPHATPQTTYVTPLPAPSPLNTTLLPNTPPPNTSSPPPPPPPPPPQSTSQHPMVTRSKVEIVKANPKYNFHVTTSSPIPKSPFYALRDRNWKQAMCDEYKALINNETWVLVPRPPNVNIVRSMCYAILAGFYHSKTDSSLFIFHKGPDTAYLLLYVDDIILTASSTSLLQHIISSLHVEFAMIDFGPLNYFLGISATHTTSGIFLSQTKYATEILKRAHMLNCNPCTTPVDTEKKLRPEGSPVTDPTLYRSLAEHFGTLPLPGPICHMQYFDLLHHNLLPTLMLTGVVVRLRASLLLDGDNLLTWSSKRQDTLSHSSAKAEYRGVVNVIAETSWIRNLLRGLHTPLFTATLVYCDNVSAVYMSANPVQHKRTLTSILFMTK